MEHYTAILRELEAGGFATSVHRMVSYCELRAVKVPAGEPICIARCDDDSDAGVMVAARQLAKMCGVVLAG